MTIALISHPDCALHNVGLTHPEQPDRVKVIEKALKAYSFSAPTQFFKAALASAQQLKSVHDKDYVDWIFSIAPKEGLLSIDPDTWMDSHSLKAALHAAGSAIQAVDLVMKKEAQVAFCNVRPPGHHAEKDKAMGFCFFNNVAVGVQHALDAHHLERIAIVDFDVHHGNGTQDIFQNEPRVLYCSSFEHPFYPGYNEALNNNHILNVPLLAGTNGETFRQKVKAAWFLKLTQFKPQLIFFSAGFDAHKNDPLANIKLTAEDYVWLTKEIASIAKLHAEGRMISMLEGGYNLEVLAECVPQHVNAMHTN